MAKRPRAAAQCSSDSESSDGEESRSRVQELRRRLRQQPTRQWRGRADEIRACLESIERKSKWPAIAAITASGCCACNTLHFCMLVYAVVVVGSALINVGGGTSPTAGQRLTAADLVAKYPESYECVATLGGDLIRRDEYSGDADALCDHSRKKGEAPVVKEISEPEVEPEPEPEPSCEKRGEFECRKNCGRAFKSPQGRVGHERSCTGPIGDAEESEEAAETDAARDWLEGLNLMEKNIVDAADVAGIKGITFKNNGVARRVNQLLEVVNDEVEGLEGPALAAKLAEVGADVVADAPPEQLRAAYRLARVRRVVKPVLRARNNFYDERGVFQRTECEAFVRGIKKLSQPTKNHRLKKMIKDVRGTPPSGYLNSGTVLQAELVKAYESQTPAVVEASNDPFEAPEIGRVIAEHGVALRSGASDDAVLEAVAKTAERFVKKTKGSLMATNYSVVFVQTLWLLELILSGRTVQDGCSKIFERFKADDEGKREGYFEAERWLSAVPGDDLPRVSYNHSERYDEDQHIRGEIVHGGNGMHGLSIVCFVVEGRKYFVLFLGHEDFVLYNEITMDCLAFVAERAVPILLAQTSVGVGTKNYGALASDELPRITDILASDLDERDNRGILRAKWNGMTSFFERFFARLLSATAEAGGTITGAPAALDAASSEVGREGECGGAGPEDHWHFDGKQVEDLVERLRRGGHFGTCFYGGGGPSPALAPPPAPPPAPPAPPPPPAGGGAAAGGGALGGFNMRQDWDRDDIMEAVNN